MKKSSFSPNKDEDNGTSNYNMKQTMIEEDRGLRLQEQLRQANAEREDKKAKSMRLIALKGQPPVIALGLVLNKQTTALYSRLHSTVFYFTFEEYTKENFLKMAPLSLWAAYLFPKRTEDWIKEREYLLWDCVKTRLTISSMMSEVYDPQRLEQVKIIEKELGIIK